MHFHSRKYIWKCRLPKWRPSCHGLSPLRPNLQYANIGSDNGIVPNRQQAIILNNDGLITDAYMR